MTIATLGAMCEELLEGMLEEAGITGAFVAGGAGLVASSE